MAEEQGGRFKIVDIDLDEDCRGKLQWILTKLVGGGQPGSSKHARPAASLAPAFRFPGSVFTYLFSRSQPHAALLFSPPHKTIHPPYSLWLFVSFQWQVLEGKEEERTISTVDLPCASIGMQMSGWMGRNIFEQRDILLLFCVACRGLLFDGIDFLYFQHISSTKTQEAVCFSNLDVRHSRICLQKVS